MPMVFPTSPIVGQVFSSGGRSWVWTGSTWDSPRSDNPPLAIPTGNAIINGGFDIWQRGTSLASPSFLADRWAIAQAAVSGISINQSRVSTTVSTETSYALRVEQGSGTTSGLIEYCARQIIERQNFQPLAGKPLTLSFWYRSNKTGNHAARIIGTIDNSGGQDLILPFTINTANTWQKIALVFNSTLNISTWGSVNAQNGIGGYVDIGFRSTGSGTPAGQASVTTGDYFELTAVQLEAGAVATPFKRNAPSIQAELAACQRYYYRVGVQGVATRFAFGVFAQAGFWGGLIYLPVPMRVTPSIAGTGSGNVYISDGATAYGSKSIIGSVNRHDVVLSNATQVVPVEFSGSGFPQFRPGYLESSGASTQAYEFSAEL